MEFSMDISIITSVLKREFSFQILRTDSEALLTV